MKPGCGKRHLHDDVVAKPAEIVVVGERVDRGRIDPCVDRPAHQGHRGRQVAVAGGLHQRDRRQHRYRGLAHGHDVDARPQPMMDGDQVVDVVVEVEGPSATGTMRASDPVGDVDVVVGEHGGDGAAQQRGVVAGHRRDDEQLRLAGAVGQRLGEMQEPAERPLPGDALGRPARRCRRRGHGRCRIPACRSGAWCARRARPPPPCCARTGCAPAGSSGS